MPAIQDVYSINVSNRFALAIDNEIDEGNESDNYGDFDPLDQLRILEEQKKKDRLPKKKNKTHTQQENEKSVSNKKEVQFKENRDANVPAHKRTSDKKEEKSKKDHSGKSAKKDDRPPPGDENKRPGKQNNQRQERQLLRDKGGEGDQYNRSYDTPLDRTNRRGPVNVVGEGRMDRRDPGGNRYERYRGSRGNFRGSRGGFGYRNNYRSDGRDDRGKREFDRRSGSDKAGVRPSDKRDGGGARNWGTPGNEFEETVDNTTFANEEMGNWGDQPETEEQGEEKQNSKPCGEDEEKKDEDDPAEAEETEEDKAPTEMTLDEWKAKQNYAGKKKQFNIRKPGEGEESDKWANMKVIHESTGSKPIHHVVTDNNLRSSSTKPVIDVNIRFDMPPRSGRGGRGGRGFRGGRGGGYRGGQRGGGRYGNRYGNQHPPPPDVLNEKEFPTLPAA